MSVDLEQTWSLYTFDMCYKKLHVMDPTKTFSLAAAYDRKHAQAIRFMKKGMSEAGALFGNEGWNIHPDEWEVVYNIRMHEPCAE